MSEWIEHDGKGSPNLPPTAKVIIRYGDGFETDRPAFTSFWGSDEFPDESNWVWPEEYPLDVFITHYKVVSE